uniref:B9 n=1 Tax=Human betaherpesvirus 6 TaxID=10368 RepID=A0A649Z3A6_9BETA|nr:hypothetical protein [Human betaherpesvirus 6]
MGISVPARAQSDLPKQRRQRLHGNKCTSPSAAQLPGADRQRLYEKKWPDRSAVQPLRGENKRHPRSRYKRAGTRAIKT